jgi:uncharacterized protein (DUF305 family)
MPARTWSAAEKFGNSMRTKLQNILPLIAALTLGIVTAVFAHNPGGKPDPMNASLEKLKGAEFEQSFLQQMIQHHRSGIEMAKLVNDHTSRSELRQFAEKMISKQQEEIEKMSGWLKSWYNASPKEVANQAADKEMKMHMSMLSGKKDSDFDKAFLEMMPKHHHAAVEMAEQAEKKAIHPELKEFAAKIAKDQQQEIKQMKNWAQFWLGPA